MEWKKLNGAQKKLGYFFSKQGAMCSVKVLVQHLPLILFFYTVRSPFLKKLEPVLVCKVIKVQTWIVRTCQKVSFFKHSKHEAGIDNPGKPEASYWLVSKPDFTHTTTHLTQIRLSVLQKWQKHGVCQRAEVTYWQRGAIMRSASRWRRWNDHRRGSP